MSKTMEEKKWLGEENKRNGFIKSRKNEGNRRDGVVVRASALQSVDQRFISQVESYQKTFKNGIHNFPAWCLAQK